MKTAGERIRELRLKNKMTLDDVARHLGVGRQAIYKYEQGTVTNILLENLEKMAEMFNTTPGYLAGWDDSRTNTHPFPPDSSAPQTLEARIVSGGMDKLPQEQREQILNVVRAMFTQHPELFNDEEGKKE